jgi:hypothetical protein
MFSKQFFPPFLGMLLAAALLLGPLSGRASADGAVYGGPGSHIAFYTETTEGPCPECTIYRYNVWLTYGYYVNYETSFVYPNSWLLGTRNLNGCIEAPITYPDNFAAFMRMIMYNPGGSVAYNWYTGDFGGGSGLCQPNDQIFAFARTAYQEYVLKGGAWASAAVKPWGYCGCTIVWTDFYWTNSGTMP